MEINSISRFHPARHENNKLTVEKTKTKETSRVSDPYDLDLTVSNTRAHFAKADTSVTCPPCNETNNSCYGTQCCTADCSGNANCTNNP